MAQSAYCSGFSDQFHEVRRLEDLEQAERQRRFFLWLTKPKDGAGLPIVRAHGLQDEVQPQEDHK